MPLLCKLRPKQLLFLTISSLLLTALLRAIVQLSDDFTERVPETQHGIERRYVVGVGSVLNSSRSVPSNRTDNKSTLDGQRDVFAKLHETERIPRIVHLIWKNRNIPTWSSQYVAKWREVNPLWQVWFWSDAAAESFIKKKYPEHYSVYKGYHSNIQRADALRYFILHEYGGTYADLDIEPLKSLEGLRQSHHCVLSTEPNAHARFCFQEKDVLALLGDRVACNAIMLCRRQHPFFKYVIDMLPAMKGDKNPVGSTGPMMLTYRYLAFRYFVDNVIGSSRAYNSLRMTNQVYLAPDDWFMPSYDTMQEGHLRKECKKTKLTPNQKEVCDLIGSSGYVNGPRSSSLTNHHWVHTWIKGANKHKDPSTVDVRKAIPEVVFPEESSQF